MRIGPMAVKVEYLRAERCSGRILPKGIVDPDKELRHLLRQRNRAAICAITEEELTGVVENLGCENAGIGRGV